MKDKFQILAQNIEGKSSNVLKTKNVLNSINIKKIIKLKLIELQKLNINLRSFNLILNKKVYNSKYYDIKPILKFLLLKKNKENLNLDENIKFIEEQNLVNNKLIQINNKNTKTIRILNNLTKNTKYIYYQQIFYNFNNINNILIKKIYKLLFNSFLSMNCLISKPIFKITNEKVIIYLFIFLYKRNYQNNTFININQNKIKILSLILSQIFKKPVELDLNRIYYPYFDNNIFVNLLAKILNQIRLRNIIKKIFKKAIIKNPFKLNSKLISMNLMSFISGINIKFAGRLLTHKIIPRKTIKFVRRGGLARIKINYLDKARYTNKNKRGAFSLTIKSGQFLI
jgi:hypothetical protein